MNAAERKALEALAASGTEIPAAGRTKRGESVNQKAADSLVEQGFAFRRELKGKAPGYVASVQGRRELDS